jgi:transcriptional regulator with XRE-family HTH domain
MTIKERRQSLGLTQVDMAIIVGVSLTAYRMWEEGLPMTEHNRKKLEAVLGEWVNGPKPRKQEEAPNDTTSSAQP